MTRKHLIVLIIVTAAIVAIALLITKIRQPETASVVGDRLYPGLEAHLNNVVKVVAQTGGHEPATLTLKDGVWQVADRWDYAADTSKIRQDLLVLARLELVEVKTRDPANYSVLGVQAPGETKEEETQSLQLFDTQGHELASVILGKTGLGGGNYVRRAGEDQAWLVSTVLRTPKMASEWLERDLFDVDESRVRSITVKPSAGESYSVSKDSPTATDFALKPILAGKEPTSDVMRLVRAFKGMRLDDVVIDSEADKNTTPWNQLTLETFDGLVLHAQTRKAADVYQLRIAAEFHEPTPAPQTSATMANDQKSTSKDPKVDADRINVRTHGWTYLLPAYRGDPLTLTLDNMLKTPESPAGH